MAQGKGLLIVALAVSLWCGALEARAAAPITDAPWVASVIRKGIDHDHDEQVIVGNIVGPNLLVTTTRWIRDYSPQLFDVRAGSNNWKKGGSLHKITKYLTHPGVSTARYGNDVGLIYVDPPFEIDETRQIIKISEDLTAAGQAVIYSFNSELEMIAVNTTINSLDYCNHALASLQGMRPAQGCVTTPNLLCEDDLGAGVVVDGALVGIMSEFVVCEEESFPLMLTNFSDPFMAMWLSGNIPTVTLD